MINRYKIFQPKKKSDFIQKWLSNFFKAKKINFSLYKNIIFPSTSWCNIYRFPFFLIFSSKNFQLVFIFSLSLIKYLIFFLNYFLCKTCDVNKVQESYRTLQKYFFTEQPGIANTHHSFCSPI